MPAPAPIPTPPSVLWREFRMRFLPPGMFAVVLALTVVLWKGVVGPSSWVGQVEPVRAVVASTQAGRLTEVRPTHLQAVAAGEKVAEILTADPRVIETQLALARARIESVRLGDGSKLREANTQVNLEQLRLDWMMRRVELATARARLAYADSAFVRMDRLYRMDETNLISVDAFEQAKRDADVAHSQVDELTRVVNEMDAAIRLLDPTGATSAERPPVSEALRAAIAVEERQLEVIESQLAPVALTAPIDGVVSMVHRQSGESVTPGEPILTISSVSPRRILAYVRQPVTSVPTVNDRVEVRAKGRRQAAAAARILAVGAALEPIEPALLGPMSGGNRVPEFGLPVVLSLPAGLRLLPGEFVDLRPFR